MLPKSFWKGVAYSRQHSADIASGKIKRDTLEDFCKAEREWIRRGEGVHHVVLAGCFIRLFIWRYGPRDMKTIDLLLDGLWQLKRESKLAEDLEFYQAQIDAYKTLRFLTQQGLSKESQPLLNHNYVNYLADPISVRWSVAW